MIASHGRARRAGRSWLLSALAASGLHAATLTGADSARACSTSTHAKPHVAAEADDTLVPGPGTAQHATGRPSIVTPTSVVPRVIPPAVLTPTRPVVVAAAPQQLPTPMPTVETWNSDHPHGLPAPAASHWGSTPPHLGPVHPPKSHPMTPLKPPASLQVTPAPEPSTALIGVALAGVFAWRRRAVKGR